MIHLIGDAPAPSVAASALRRAFPKQDPIVTTDFSVSGEAALPLEAPSGELLGFRYVSEGREIISIDHHGDDRRMWRHISSTNLAMTFVQEYGSVEAVGITHTDCDSVLASEILSGKLSADDHRLGAAAIAADHTGEEDTFADLLQAIQDERDVVYSLRCLELLQQGGEKALPSAARQALHARRRERRHIQALIQSGIFQQRGRGVYAAYLDFRIDGELLPAQLPDDALVILTVSPPVSEGAGGVVKTRLGRAAPVGLSLFDLGLAKWGWEGRWNAGSTGRHGGTRDPEALIEAVVKAVSQRSHA
jgi:hypothetical protein